MYSLRERRRPDPKALYAMLPAWMQPKPTPPGYENIIVRAVKRDAAGEVIDLRYLTPTGRWSDSAAYACVFAPAPGAHMFASITPPFGFVRDVINTISKAHVG